MKKNIMLTIAAAFLSLVIFAQENSAPPTGARSMQGQGRPHGTPQERAKQATDKLNAVVTLTPDQYTKVLEVNTNFSTQREALRGAGGPPSDDVKAKMKAMNEDREAKIKAILTAEQWKKHEEARKTQMNNMNSTRPGEE